MSDADQDSNELIVTIVSKGSAETVLDAAREAGAGGGTILHGRGAGRHETQKFLGIPVEPEKEILLTVVPRPRTRAVFDAVVRAGRLDEPGYGIAFTVPVTHIAGLVSPGGLR